MKKKENTLLTVLLAFILLNAVAGFIFLPYLFMDRAFILGWDMRVLYASNFENLRTVMMNLKNNGIMPFWSWSSFLGNDFYSTKLFYFQDIFDYPFALTALPYSEIIPVQTYLKFMTAGLSFLYYAGVNRCSRRSALISSLIFAYSAYNLQTMMHPFFASFFVFLPLYFAAVDRYILNRKKGLFIFMVFFLFMNNYYLFYSVSLFTILYYIWRWDREYRTMKGMLPSAFVLIGCYLIGFAMSGIAVLPEAVSILANSRIGSRSAVLLFDRILPYLDFLSGLFLPTSMLANRETAISMLYSYDTVNRSVMAVFLWSSSLTGLLVPQYLFGRNRNTVSRISIAVICAVGLVPILSSVMHGFSEPSFRWLGSVSFFLTAMILPLLDDGETDRRVLAWSAITAVLITALSPALTALLSGIPLAEILPEYWLALVCLPTLLIIWFLLYRNRKALVIIPVLAELCVVSYFSFFGNPPFSELGKPDMDRTATILGEKGYYQSWMNMLDGNNPRQFIRNYVDSWGVYWGLSTNYNLYYDLMGVMGYDSTYTASTNDLKLLNEEKVVDYLPWTFNVTDPDIMTLVSTKYAIVSEEEQVPFHNYRFAADYAAMKVYENLDYYNLGKTYTRVMTYDEYEPAKASLLSDVLICHKEDLAEISALLGKEEVRGFTEAVPAGNNLYAKITTAEKGFAVMAVPWHKGWSVTVNGTPVRTYAVSGGLTGIPVVSGYNEIVMTFTPVGLRAGAFLSAGGCALFLLVLVIDPFIRRKHRS